MSSILAKTTNKEFVDHIDHNRQNNNISNLRWVTREQNNRNKLKHKNNTTGITGVVWSKDKERWRARITYNGTVKHLGYFSTLEAAKRARNKAVKLHFGEFANNSV